MTVMLFSSRAFRFVAMKSLLFVLLAFHGGTSGLPVGPRAPDAASGSSVDGSVYVHREGEGTHGGEDGASKYLHMGQDPKPATVDGSPFLETKVKVLVSGGEVFPKPASPGLARRRHLLWFGFGGGDDDKDEQENQNEAGEKKVTQEGPDQHEEKTEEKARVDGEKKLGDGEGTFNEEADDSLDDADHIWHDDDHEERDDDTEDDNEDGYYSDGASEHDDDHHDTDDGIIYTHGKILKVAKSLLNEYQLKSLNIKEELTDVKGREKAAERLESDIDTEIDLLMKRAGDTDAEDEGNGEVKKLEFLERMMGAKKDAKKRVKDILTGHNVHFDKDDL
ncbi:protein PFC0760c-like [Patiria miniata]|uniref:Uncharacterized protein n=1 Tax=Patiria miniata TaxID=46514 RepID=A0A913ZHN1_PATMI|nr:protein PFC0760c-like [Patiria miniata]